VDDQIFKIPLTPEIISYSVNWVKEKFGKTEYYNIILANALAVCAVQKILQDINIIENSSLLPKSIFNGENYFLQLSDFAFIGVICVSPEASQINPFQKWSLCKGYFVVSLDESLESIEKSTTAEIIGYTPNFMEPIKIFDLQGFEAFYETLDLFNKEDVTIPC
jgi:hypothetical protein